MFSFFARKKTSDSQRYIRRLVDLTIPNRAGPDNLDRCENRQNRCLPTMLCPWRDDRPVVREAIVALTKDFADRGVGLVMRSDFDADLAAVGFCHPEATDGVPWFFLGLRRMSVPIGGGFWLLGIELTEFMNEHWKTELDPLVPLAERLLPPPWPTNRPMPMKPVEAAAH